MKSGKTSVGKKKTVKRLKPTPEVLRQLYILSGNNCAIPDCPNVIIDYKGVVVGHICHIEAAMPGGPRFNELQTNDDRRKIENLVLACAGHHEIIDSKQHESAWTVERLKKIKSDHENSFKGRIDSLQKAFDEPYKDSTDSLSASSPNTFDEFNKQIPESEIELKYKVKCVAEMRDYTDKLSKVPLDIRRFMTAILKRSFKLSGSTEYIQVHINDVEKALSISQTELKSLGDDLERYEVGDIGLRAVGDYDQPHVMIFNPSEYLFWWDVNEFCKKTNIELERFTIDIDFGLLD